MKLFGNSKSGKHTAGTGHQHPAHPEQDIDKHVRDSRADVPQPEEKYTPPVPAPEEKAEMSVPTPAAPKSRQEQEDGLFHSIVEAVSKVDNLSVDPEKEEPTAQPREPREERIESAEPFAEDFPPPEPPHEGMSGGKKALIIAGSVLGIILLIALAAVVVMELWITPPAIDNDVTLNTPVVTPKMNEEDDDPPEQTNQTGRKEGCFTFAIAGIDVASGNTDVILVGRLDTVGGTLNVISIPRDTLMNYGTYKINSAYAIGKNSGKGGVENLKKELKKLMGFEVDNYAIVDTKAVEELIDAIGGVDFDVPVNMNYEDPIQGLSIHINKGLQHLSGADAVKVLRFRGTYAGGDIQRIGVQQEFFKAIAKQMLDLGNIPNLQAAIEIYEKRVETDLEPKHVGFYVKQFLMLDFDNIHFDTLPGNTNGSINGGSYVFIYVDEWLAMVNEYLNPFYEQVTENHVSIKTSTNGTSFTTTPGAANY